ncbi:MAG: TRAP transporter small permease subunit [Pseudomonadota bacterium]|nr:TRAP transporter small permease subunit [Pseudomonadota bacterium]
MQRLAGLLRTGSGLIVTVLRYFAHSLSWTMLVLVVVVCTDIITRKLGLHVPYLDSTRFQELAWHLQAVIFCAWIGYAYTQNAHIRVDVFVATLSPRKRSLIEVFGCLLLALPYLLIVMPYAYEFVRVSYNQGEASSSPTGLPYRWIVKSVLYVGFWGVFLANIAVLMRSLADLCDPKPATRGEAHG